MVNVKEAVQTGIETVVLPTGAGEIIGATKAAAVLATDYAIWKKRTETTIRKTKKFTNYFLLLFLFLPGNIYLAYYFFATHRFAKKLTALQDGEYKISRLNPEYIILTHKYKGSDDFFCVTPQKGVSMQFENNRFTQITAWNNKNYFSWLDCNMYRILSYEKKSIVDYNKDFIPDAVVFHEKNQKFIIVKGKYLPVKTLSQMESAETYDGRKFVWHNNSWIKK